MVYTLASVWCHCSLYLQNVPSLKVKKIVGGKRFKRVNGYNLFFSHYVRKNSEISPGMANRNLYMQCHFSNEHFITKILVHI